MWWLPIYVLSVAKSRRIKTLLSGGCVAKRVIVPTSVNAQKKFTYQGKSYTDVILHRRNHQTISKPHHDLDAFMTRCKTTGNPFVMEPASWRHDAHHRQCRNEWLHHALSWRCFRTRLYSWWQHSIDVKAQPERKWYGTLAETKENRKENVLVIGCQGSWGYLHRNCVETDNWG